MIRDHLDLGRPSRVQLLFDRESIKTTPGKFATRIITDGVIPSRHVQYKPYDVKQDFKEGRALRTATTIHDAHDRGLSERALTDLVLPSTTADGQPAAALKLGPPRVTALLQALCLFAVLPAGITSRQLRPHVAQLLGGPDDQDTARQMGYDLRRLVRNGLLQRLGRQLRYPLTTSGRRLALFLAKLLTRVIRPGLQALDPLLPSTVSPALRIGLQEVDIAGRAMLNDARLAA